MRNLGIQVKQQDVSKIKHPTSLCHLVTHI